MPLVSESQGRVDSKLHKVLNYRSNRGAFENLLGDCGRVESSGSSNKCCKKFDISDEDWEDMDLKIFD